jgi:hypothetical protein
MENVMDSKFQWCNTTNEVVEYKMDGFSTLMYYTSEYNNMAKCVKKLQKV